MQWEIINIQDQPQCIACDKTTKQMARFQSQYNQHFYICSSCARYVKDCMNKWGGLKDVNYIEQAGNIFKSDLIDEALDKGKALANNSGYLNEYNE